MEKKILKPSCAGNPYCDCDNTISDHRLHPNTSCYKCRCIEYRIREDQFELAEIGG